MSSLSQWNQQVRRLGSLSDEVTTALPLSVPSEMMAHDQK
jgi:hypothetical protein